MIVSVLKNGGRSVQSEDKPIKMIIVAFHVCLSLAAERQEDMEPLSSSGALTSHVAIRVRAAREVENDHFLLRHCC